MSHYSVLVLHKEDQNIDTLLAPYDENLEVEPYLKLTNDEAIIKANKNLTNSMNSKNWEIIGSDIKTLQELIDKLEVQKKKDDEQKKNNTNNTSNIIENKIK